MNDRKDRLLDVAEAVADGTPVDWEDHIRSFPDQADQLQQLRSIEQVVLAFRESSKAPPPSQWGSLEVLEKLGEGTFGEVYRAHDPSLQRDVALKLLRTSRGHDAHSERRFINEARRLARVRHDNVVVVHGADRHQGRAGLWTDLIDGRTLEECLKEQGPFGPSEACLIGIDLCHALAAVHGAGLLYQDMKTANVMRETGGRIVLMDFSAARDRSVTASGSERRPISGTPLFMAPELFRGADASVAADVYSLGVVLYRLVSGKFPVEANSVAELCGKHDRRESTLLRDVRPDLPNAFVQVVEQALAQTPERRYSSVGEFEHALTLAFGSEPPVPSPNPWWRRWPVAAAAVLVLLAAIVLVVEPPSSWFLFDVEASLYRAGEATDERLTDGTRVLTGDRLFLEIEGTREMYVYILNSDQMGDAFVLFPLPGLDRQNPLPPKVRHRLPGVIDGEVNYWKVSSAGGEETFLVVASRKPLDEVERRLQSVPRAGATGAIELDPDTLEGLRGIGGVVPQPGRDDRPLSDIYTSLTRRASQEKDLWVWQTRLRNPVE
jgi:hypothetical protein